MGRVNTLIFSLFQLPLPLSLKPNGFPVSFTSEEGRRGGKKKTTFFVCTAQLLGKQCCLLSPGCLFPGLRQIFHLAKSSVRGLRE